MSLAGFLRRAADAFPDAIALYRDDTAVADYRGFYRRCLQAGALFTRRYGLQRGARVAILADNLPGYLVAMFGAWCAGLVVVPINARLHPREARGILDDSGASLCLCCPRWRDALDKDAGAAEPGPALLDFDELESGAASREPAPLAACRGDDVAWLFYTSGTTGAPKGVMLTHQNLRQMALNFFADVRRPGPGDSLVHFAPLSHGSGMYAIPFVAAGAANVVPVDAAFGSADCVSLLNAHRGSSLFLSPTMVRRLVGRADIDRLDSGRVHTIVYGGGPMATADIRRAVSVLGPRFTQIYGQGESPMTITCLPAAEIEQAVAHGDDAILASAGRPFSGVEVRVLDEDGAERAPGAVGEVAVSGPIVMRGYLNRAQATAEQIRDGWLRTGDLGSFDGRGYLSLKGRSRDMIISGGMNIYPVEVEDVLAAHPSVCESAVIGVADPEWGERVVAYVVPGGDPLAAEILDAHCLTRLARFKRPREYRFVDELPKNSYGKILKRELQARARDGAAPQQEANHG